MVSNGNHIQWFHRNTTKKMYKQREKKLITVTRLNEKLFCKQYHQESKIIHRWEEKYLQTIYLMRNMHPEYIKGFKNQ